MPIMHGSYSHAEEPRKEEHDAYDRDVHMFFAHPAVTYDGRRQEDHEYASRDQAHLAWWQRRLVRVGITRQGRLGVSTSG